MRQVGGDLYSVVLHSVCDLCVMIETQKLEALRGQTVSMNCNIGSITDCHSREGGNP